MWPLWGLDLNRVRCDLLFTEAINQRMQVPNRLKVAESCSPGDRRTVAEDVPASFRMHIPDRISLAEAGRIYSMQNIFHTMYLLGQVLFHRVQDSLQDPALPSSQEPVPAAESASEEAGVTEVAAMRRQLARISGRLRVLEEQSHAWRQKEALVYSVMISACLINTWLWLRR
ncbi:hypothetical protein DUI87_25202 [Hirundo rustica rustica]|uniref:Mitochondrial fission factor n=1 Tax=Hirundo rustica rustica TaxID=333673 RepID=A0A3M0JAU0_HIRRU|nr:hypothetical protein DUI87_25202 [Hirundo rustica rustica]